jgi:copper transport protein
MSAHGRAGLAAALVAAVALLAPAAAFGHAALLRTSPQASVTVIGSPARVSLTYSEVIEPKFAIVSVTDAAGHSEVAGPPTRSKADVRRIDVPVKHLDRGWYLVFWRVISADGHPVRGAFTFAVGPNAGPAPQFVIPSLRETAAKPSLLIARWVMFLSLMAAVGLLAFRLFIARPILRRVPDSSLRAVSIALGIAFAVALIATPVYVDLATAQFTLRSAFDVGALIPLMRGSSFGRSLLDLEIVLALAALASAIAVRLDRPDRELRSVAQLLALIGAGAAVAATLVVPGLAGHAADYSPRGISLGLDWVHLVSASLWVGGLIGLVVLGVTASSRRVACMVVTVPRFSKVALGSVLVLIASGTVVSFIRLPTLSSLWNTGYGQALIIKVGILVLALCLAAVNLLRTTPRLEAARERPGLGESTVSTLRRLVAGEVSLVVAAIFVAGVLSSLAPPPKALAGIGSVQATVGPGPVTRTVSKGAYKVAVKIAPNRAAVPNAFEVRVTRDGQPVRNADVVAKFTMLDMEMTPQAYHLDQQGPAVYSKKNLPSLVMVGRWGLNVSISPPGQQPFDVLLLDHANG